MLDIRRFDGARCVSLDFDGVLSTLVLGRAWEKTRQKKRPIPVISPAVRGLKHGLAALTEGLRKPLPQAERSLRQLRAAQRTLCILTSRTGERIAAAERWLDRYAWTGLFERSFFNTGGEDADRFKERILRTHAIDVHIDDDPETLAHLSGLFPDKLFIHMDYYHRKGPVGANIVDVRGWDEVPALFEVNGEKFKR
jgi:hypothetical protein